MCLSSLPRELVRDHVLSYGSVSDLTRLEACSKDTRALVSEADAVWQSHYDRLSHLGVLAYTQKAVQRWHRVQQFASSPDAAQRDWLPSPMEQHQYEYFLRAYTMDEVVFEGFVPFRSSRCGLRLQLPKDEFFEDDNICFAVVAVQGTKMRRVLSNAHKIPTLDACVCGTALVIEWSWRRKPRGRHPL